MPYLFLTPEYLGEVNFLSYFIVGITSGLFVMAYHISSYIYYSYRFPFLATLDRPLWKFCLNNSIIPFIFYGVYVVQIFLVLQSEGYQWHQILLNILGLLLGSIVLIFLTFTYFFKTIRGLEMPDKKGKERNPLKHIIKKDKASENKGLKTPSKVNHYLKNLFTIKLARDASHYRKEVLIKTMQEHHFSASLFFVLLILIVVALNYKAFMFPAGASLFLIFSLYLMITGAIYTRLKTWTLSVGIAAIILLNYLSGINGLSSRNYAYGMDYEVEPAEYTYEKPGTFNYGFNSKVR